MNLLAEMAPHLCKHQDCVCNGLCQAIRTIDGVVHQGDCEYQERLRAALSAALKHGFKLVPVEPTGEMLGAAWEACRRPTIEIALATTAEQCQRLKAQHRYRAMIEAAPSIEGDG